MYVSKLFVKDFRSLKYATVKFQRGKNVLVGKNNSGKSNIIEALDILFGERSPVYRTFEDDDFYTEGDEADIIADNFFLCATIGGNDINEAEIRLIKKSTALSKLKSPESVLTEEDGVISINYQLLTDLSNLEANEEVEVLHETNRAGNDYATKVKWLKSEELLKFLKHASAVKLFFAKPREDESGGYGLLISDDKKGLWITHFLSSRLRNSLITTAVVQPYRSPKEELRMVHYTWYGKLIKSIWDRGEQETKDQILEKSNDIKKIADQVFDQTTIDLKDLVKKAIAHHTVTFKLLPETKTDLYKNVRIYIDDGIDRPLEKKGTGIQSAVIVALFTVYCDKFHPSSSLLIVEEPELFLHPHAKRVISAELESFVNKEMDRQVILSTHSSEFVRNVPIDRIALLSKEGRSTKIIQIDGKTNISEEEERRIVRVIWTKNREVFFADQVLLVEGAEEYLLPAIFDSLTQSKQILDYYNISVARVDGKSNFVNYVKVLNAFQIPWMILADLDCYDDELSKICNKLGINIPGLNVFLERVKRAPDHDKIMKNVFGRRTSFDGERLRALFSQIRTGKLAPDSQDLQDLIDHVESRFRTGNLRKVITEDPKLVKTFDEIQAELKKNNIFVLSLGELEDYFTDFARNVPGSGKDNKVLEIAGRVSEGDRGNLSEYFVRYDEFEELYELLIKNPDNDHYPA